MKSTFPGFPREGIAFLRALKKNNDREWFTPRKAGFEATVKQPMIELVGAIHREMMRFAPQYVGEPAKCVYRIYRDTRFSKDKTPYKTFASALLLRNGFDRHAGGAGLTISRFAGRRSKSRAACIRRIATCCWRVREYIAENHKAFRAAFATPKVKKLLGDLWGDSVSRVPKGFDPEHPAADLIAAEALLLNAQLDPKIATTPKLLTETCDAHRGDDAVCGIPQPAARGETGETGARRVL